MNVFVELMIDKEKVFVGKELIALEKVDDLLKC